MEAEATKEIGAGAVFNVDTDGPIGLETMESARLISDTTPRSAKALKFVEILKQLEETNDFKLLFRTLGVTEVSDLISAVVDPETYQKNDKSDIGGNVEVVSKALHCVFDNAGESSDLSRLVEKWSDMEYLNVFVVSELFAKSKDLGLRFVSVSIVRCFFMMHSDSDSNAENRKSNAQTLAAAVCHVLSTLSNDIDLMPIFVPLLCDGIYYKFVALALGGEKELPLLVDMAQTPEHVEATINHHDFGNVVELLANVRKSFIKHLDDVPLDLMNDQELVEEYCRLLDDLNVSSSRLSDIEDEIERRSKQKSVPSMGLLPFYETRRGFGPHLPMNKSVTPELAEEILRNVSRGCPPFGLDDEKQKVDHVWWFDVTRDEDEDTDTKADIVSIAVELIGKPFITIGEAELLSMYDECKPVALKATETQFRSRHGLNDNVELDARQLCLVSFVAEGIAEKDVWEMVSERIKASEEKIGNVCLSSSRFADRVDGRDFVVACDPAVVSVQNGVQTVMEALRKHGMEAEPYIMEAAKELMEALKHAGKIDAGFRIGGRVFLVISIAKDTYKIITAKNKVKASVETVGGWAGAAAAGGTFAHFFIPAHVAGPMAWIAHGIGTFIAGLTGYWVGTSTCCWVYGLVLVEL